jgi:hypothetical protein
LSFEETNRKRRIIVMARFNQRKEAWLEGIRGPFFPEGIDELTRIFRENPITFEDLNNLYRLVTSSVGCGKARSADGYQWYANMFFLAKGKGHLQILFPQREDDTSAAVYQQGAEVPEAEVIFVMKAVMAALPQLPDLREKDPKTRRLRE